MLAVMGRKKKEPDRHVQRRITLRLPDSLAEQLDKLVQYKASEANHEIRNAIRRFLETEGYWPPPAKD